MILAFVILLSVAILVLFWLDQRKKHSPYP